MKILLITQYFKPIKGAAAKRTGKFAHFLVDAGHQVSVLTGFPSYPTGKLDRKYTWKLWTHEHDGDIKITRVYEYPAAANGSTFKRLLNMISFVKSACWYALFHRNYDAVIVSSPSFLSGIAGLWALNRKTRFYFDIRDLWPDSAIQLGLLQEGSAFAKYLKNVEKKFYARSNKIFAATPGIKNHLISENVSSDKIEVLLNSVDTDIFKPAKPDFESFGYNSFGYDPDDFVCGYVGNHSRIYDLETVIKAAEILKEHEKIKFLLIGEGEDKDKLKKLAQNLPNVRFEDEKRLNDLTPFINCFSIGLAPIANIGVSQESFPSKISEYFACAKPVVASISGDMKKIIEDSEAGIVYHPGDVETLAESLLKLCENKELTQKMGQNARKLALEVFSDQIAEEILIKNIT